MRAGMRNYFMWPKGKFLAEKYLKVLYSYFPCKRYDKGLLTNVQAIQDELLRTHALSALPLVVATLRINWTNVCRVVRWCRLNCHCRLMVPMIYNNIIVTTVDISPTYCNSSEIIILLSWRTIALYLYDDCYCMGNIKWLYCHATHTPFSVWHWIRIIFTKITIACVRVIVKCALAYSENKLYMHASYLSPHCTNDCSAQALTLLVHL